MSCDCDSDSDVDESQYYQNRIECLRTHTNLRCDGEFNSAQTVLFCFGNTPSHVLHERTMRGGYSHRNIQLTVISHFM